MKQITLALLSFLICLSAASQYAPGTKYVANKYEQKFPVAASRATVAKAVSKLAAVKTIFPASTVWSAPITITKGGHYTGNWKSDNSGTPAVLVQTYDTVWIENSNMLSSGEIIKAYGGTKLIVRNNNMVGQTPTDNNQYGRALNDYHPQFLIFENNYVEHTGGLLVDHSDENTKFVQIRYNLIRNTDRRRVDGSAGELRASILINTATLSGDISWNKFENIPDSSYVEDNINCGNVVATQAKPLNIHHNLIVGAYPAPLTTGTYTGSGITVEGAPSVNTPETVSQWINIYSNTIVSTCNAGLNVNAGHNIKTYNNVIVSSGMFPNGVKSLLFWGAKAFWNGSGVSFPSVFHDITNEGDTIGYVRDDRNAPLVGRQDWVTVDGSPISVDPAKDYHLPNPITLSTENTYKLRFAALAAKNNISIGNVSNTPVTPTPEAQGLSFKINQTALAIVYPINAKGDTVSYQKGKTVVTSTGYIVTPTITAQDEKKITLTLKPIAVGTGTVTVAVTTLGGKLITKTFDVTVLPDPAVVDNEAVALIISFVVI